MQTGKVFIHHEFGKMTKSDECKLNSSFEFLDDVDWEAVWRAFKIISMNFTDKMEDRNLSMEKMTEFMHAKYQKWLAKNLDTVEVEIAMRLIFAQQTTMAVLDFELSTKNELAFLAKAIGSLDVVNENGKK